MSQIFIVRGIIRFAKIRAGCRCRLYRIAEDNHGKARVGENDDGISYLEMTKHLQFRVVFKEEVQAENFETQVRRIPLEYRKRKYAESTNAVVPDITTETEMIRVENWSGDLRRIWQEDYEKIEGDTDPSPEYDATSYEHASVVSINDETRLRLLERENSRNFFRQKPEKCHIVRRADDAGNSRNPNNIVYMSRFLHQHFDVIDSTEGIPTFYFQYVNHNAQHIQGLINNKPVLMYETTVKVVFKDEEAMNELSSYFKNPTIVSQTEVLLTAYFPDPFEFRQFAEINAEETLARWASYDGILNN